MNSFLLILKGNYNSTVTNLSWSRFGFKLAQLDINEWAKNIDRSLFVVDCSNK